MHKRIHTYENKKKIYKIYIYLLIYDVKFGKMLRFEYENILNAVRIKCVRFRYENHRNRLVLAIRNNDSVLRNDIKIMRYVRPHPVSRTTTEIVTRIRDYAILRAYLYVFCARL